MMTLSYMNVWFDFLVSYVFYWWNMNIVSLMDKLFTQPVVELVEWQTAESEVPGSNPRARFSLIEQKPVIYH